MYTRTKDRDTATTWATREAQYDAVCTWGIPDHAALQRLAAIRHPVFVANGDSDPMIPPRYSHLIAGLLQCDAFDERMIGVEQRPDHVIF